MGFQGRLFLPGKSIPTREEYPYNGGVSLSGKSFFAKGGFSCQGRVSLQGMGFPFKEMLLSGKRMISCQEREWKVMFPCKSKDSLTINVNFRHTAWITKLENSLARSAQNGKLFRDGISTYSEKYSPLLQS